MSSVVEHPGAGSVERYVAEFEAAADRRPAGPAWLEARRRDAMERFTALGLPTTRDEEYRFTNVGPITATEFVRAAEVERRSRGDRRAPLRRRRGGRDRLRQRALLGVSLGGRNAGCRGRRWPPRGSPPDRRRRVARGRRGAGLGIHRPEHRLVRRRRDGLCAEERRARETDQHRLRHDGYGAGDGELPTRAARRRRAQPGAGHRDALGPAARTSLRREEPSQPNSRLEHYRPQLERPDVPLLPAAPHARRRRRTRSARRRDRRNDPAGCSAAKASTAR